MRYGIQSLFSSKAGTGAVRPAWFATAVFSPPGIAAGAGTTTVATAIHTDQSHPRRRNRPVAWTELSHTTGVTLMVE